MEAMVVDSGGVYADGWPEESIVTGRNGVLVDVDERKDLREASMGVVAVQRGLGICRLMHIRRWHRAPGRQARQCLKWSEECLCRAKRGRCWAVKRLSNEQVAGISD